MASCAGLCTGVCVGAGSWQTSQLPQLIWGVSFLLASPLSQRRTCASRIIHRFRVYCFYNGLYCSPSKAAF